MEVKRFGVLSVGKVAGVLFALLEFILGSLMSLIFLVCIAAIGEGNSSMAADMISFVVFGTVLFPVIYGIFGVVSALLYNVMARLIGGVEVDLEQR